MILGEVCIYTIGMSKRLQVVLDEERLDRYERTARARGLTLSAWVRETLASAEREVYLGDVDDRLEAIRRAYSHSFPAPDLDVMLAEIEQGYVPSMPE